jgi:hypothetical protein
MDEADQELEAGTATIRDCVRRQNAVTLKHQKAIYTEKLRPSKSTLTVACNVLTLLHLLFV